MRLRLKQIRDQVIVITGASSGIGLTTAQMAVERGARVVLNARDSGELERIVDGIRTAGGHAIAAPGDVADAEAMELVGRRALEAFGCIDTWVNNAGVGLYGRLAEVPLEDKRRLFDVNFWGVVHGCRAALPHLRRRGGAIINIGSIESDVAIPLHGIYAASKHAVQAYTDVLRMELEHDGVPIAVTLVKPAAINTPFVEHAHNEMAEEPEYPAPTYAPEAVAETILRCAARPTREIIVGGAGRVLTAMRTLAPRVTDLYLESTMFEQQQQREGRANRADALYEPAGDGRRRSHSGRLTFERSAYTRAALSDVTRVLPFVAVAGAIAVGVNALRKAS